MSNQLAWLQKFRFDDSKKDSLGEIVFSGPTYQIEVIDSEGNKFWPFLQFDEKGALKDAFCSCESEEEHCRHLAFAFSKIYKGHKLPLHQRFQRSFWNRLFLILADHIGYSSSSLQKTQKGYAYQNEIQFSLQFKNEEGKKRIESFLGPRHKETPENSLKFSSLTAEEISHWKEGRPSASLRYELSFWSDIAKWMMLYHEDEKDYTLTFQDVDDLPLHLTFECTFLKLEVTITEGELEKLIPSLEKVRSSLKVIKQPEQGIVSITYDPIKQCLDIQREKTTPILFQRQQEGKKIGSWWYIPQEGFYPESQESSLKGTFICKEDIGHTLDSFSDLIAAHLRNLKVVSQTKILSYDLFFDPQWNWHFHAYLFKKDDLKHPLDAFFGNWVYIHERGFFRVEEPLFETPQKILSPNEVSSFINQHRIWLNSQKGFNTHLAGIEAHLSYAVKKDGNLRFYSQLRTEETLEIKDFGDWIYIQKQGFFSKKLSRLGDVVRPGVEVPAAELSSFIRKYREELENVPHFFFPICPLALRGLSIQGRSSTSIAITPKERVLPEFESLHLRFFGDFVYIEGKGFNELPIPFRIHPQYQKEMIIHQDRLQGFFDEEFEQLSESIIELDPRLKKPHKLALEVHSLSRNPEGGLKAELYYASEHGKVSLIDFFDAIQKKRRYLFSEAGRIDLFDPRLQWIRQQKMPTVDEQGILQLSVMEFMRLETFEGLLGPSEETPHAQETRSLLHELRDFIVSDKPSPKELKSHLRLYQQTGLEWLWFLYRNGLSGLLCDEMGLGKTHQAMALMASIKQKKEKKKCLFLVVCPTSVIYHWQDKLQNFLPGLKVVMFHGIKRSLKRLPKVGVILTTYGILRMDRKELTSIPFEVAIYDEIQMAKNPQSQIHNALSEMKANMRLGLTGTPIENNLRELKSLFDIILPGYFPSESFYREHFTIPIEREGSEEKKKLLINVIHPFILRRRKKEVLQELPEKSEDVYYCDLSSEQALLYSETLQKNRKQVLETLQSGESPIPYVHIFSILSTLKQICDHPALVHKDPHNYKNYSSAKWDQFTELLEEALESEQKVVIFTQYLFMLDIMQNYFKEKKWDYAQIRGDTSDRKEQLRRFQEDPGCRIFIGSLQAAGVGIDLTAANIVILYDRWWNAARENQAIDRVHRIGQKWAVQVFKLITKGTIEEKIDRIISKKGELMENVILSDDQATIKKFNRSDLIDLLTLGDTNQE